ncbi:MAG: D-arabinono-1,4-lactone oxidase [Pseudomonadales bacterium]
MERWQNWSGRHKLEVQDLRYIRSEEEALAIAVQAAKAGQTIRVIGSGHSHSLLVPNEQVLIEASGLAGVMSIDAERKTAQVAAGAKIYSLGRPLREAGLALKNQGDIDRQAIAGACATGTHGTGKNLQNLSASVIGLTLATASGELLHCDASQHEELWRAARLSLGAFGIITRIELQLREAFKLKESGTQMLYPDLKDKMPELIAAHDRFEFFWFPQSDEATVKLTNETTTDPVYPIAEEGSRLGWSYEVMPSHRPHPHTEMEYSIPAEHGPECFARIRELLQTRFTNVRWPVEYRLVAEDDVWLSMANGRATVTISVHEDIRVDESAYYEACEKIFLEYGGRPHWGKVNYLSAQQLEAVHPDWHAWWQVRDKVDPNGVFLNDYLRRLRP